MSSILIKGMKKPENCFHCPMGYKYGDVDDPKLMCTITATVIPLGKSLDIMKNCPLVEIPPHGRLIDADKLAGVIKKDLTTAEEVLMYNLRPQERVRLQNHIEMDNILLDKVAKAPTILETGGNYEHTD